jgi:hypothetical protein
MIALINRTDALGTMQPPLLPALKARENITTSTPASSARVQRSKHEPSYASITQTNVEIGIRDVMLICLYGSFKNSMQKSVRNVSEHLFQ